MQQTYKKSIILALASAALATKIPTLEQLLRPQGEQNRPCSGFRALPGRPLPPCDEGYECLPNIFITLPGQPDFTCQKIKTTAGIGETCGGFDFMTLSPFPSCEEGLECRDSGRKTIPGAENICVDSICPSDQYFDKQICQCASEQKCDLQCEYPLVQDPIYGCACLTQEKFDEIFAHTKGLDCAEGTSDDFKITRKSSPSECGPGEYWNEDDCNCYNSMQCWKMCPPGQELDPRYPCQCEWQTNLDLLFAHDLGETCGLGGIGDGCSTHDDCLSTLQCAENVCTEFLFPDSHGQIGDSCTTGDDCLSTLQCAENVCTEFIFPVGGWGREQIPSQDDLAVFYADEVIGQIFDQASFDICGLKAIAFRTQVVAGRTHVVKYKGTSCDNDFQEFFFLATIYEHFMEAAEVLRVSEEVPADSHVPEGF